MPLDVTQLLQRQAVHRELQRRLGRHAIGLPCVALSRLPGSGAATLGQDVARELGFTFLGIEIVDRMAREDGVPLQLAAAFDEHVRNAIDRYVVDAFREDAFVESDYLRHLVRTVRSIGEAGGAVILGRGSNYILSPERTLRVLVVAPREARIENLARAHGLSPGEALREIEREDEERQRFLTHHFRAEPDDPTTFDLCVNTSLLPREAACAAVVAALRSRFDLPREHAGAATA